MEIKPASGSPANMTFPGRTDPAAAAAKAEQTAKQTAAAAPASDADVQSALDNVNLLVAEINSSIHFQYHQATDQLVVKIVDSQTGQTLRQYPPEEFLDMMEQLSDYIGMILDKKV